MKVKAGLVMKRFSWMVVVLCFLLDIAWADVAGRISGFVNDPSGALVAGATVALTNTSSGTKQTTTTNDQGQYSFPVVPIGRYGLEINSPGFQSYKKIGIVVDLNSALQVDATLQIKNAETVEVNDSVVTIQMSETEIGETISSQHVAEAPLNGRSYTDLVYLALVSVPYRSGLLITRMTPAVPFFRRAAEAWPYVFIAGSVAGLTYIALNATR